MASLAGFFAISYIAESAVRSSLEAAWNASWKITRGALSYTTATPVGQLRATGACSLEKPWITFVGSANAAKVELAAAARLDLEIDGASAGGVYIQATAAIQLPVSVTQDAASTTTQVDLSGFTLDSLELHLTWYRDPPTTRSETAVLSDASRTRLADEFRNRAKPFLTLTLPTDRIFTAEIALLTAGGPGTVIVPPFIKLAGARVLDGWLAVCIDDTSTPTHGDLSDVDVPSPLPPSGTSIPYDTAIFIDGDVLQSYLQLNAKLAVRIAAGAHPSIMPDDNVAVRISDNAIEVTNTGKYESPDPFPAAPYSATIKIKPFISGGRETWFYASVSPDIRLDTSIWMDIIGGVADFFGADVFAKLRRASQGQLASLFYGSIQKDVPGVPGLSGFLDPRQLVLEPQTTAIYGYGGMYTSAPSAPTQPDISVTVMEGAPPWHDLHVRDRYLQFWLYPPECPLLIADPTYLLRYSVLRGSDGTVVESGTEWSGSAPFTRKIDIWQPAVYLETDYRLQVVIERPPGNAIGHYSNPSIRIHDFFDRSHPYARWRHVTTWHKVIPPSTPETTTYVRESVVHKTAIAERCKFGDYKPGRFPRYEVQPLDSLPPPDDDRFSSRLCPYCFRSP